ncbi:MAG: type II CAAX prenyl endopeptidase Rce1 family protein [Streptococcus sp.]
MFKTGFRSRSLVCLIFWFGPSRESHSSTLGCYPVPSLLCARLSGIFFAAIYLRTGSLWWTIILHCLVDFASVLLSQSTQAAPATSIWNFIFWLPLIALGLFLIRPKKLKAIRYLND